MSLYNNVNEDRIIYHYALKGMKDKKKLKVVPKNFFCVCKKSFFFVCLSKANQRK